MKGQKATCTKHNTEKFHVNIRKRFTIVSIVKCYNALPRKPARSPFLDRLKNLTRLVPEQPPLADAAFTRRAGLDDLQRSLPTSMTP